MEELWQQFDRIVVFDTETTGIAFGKDRIIELGAVSLEAGAETGSLDVLVRLPEGGVLPPFIVELTGITDAQLLSEGVDQAEAAEDFCRLLEGCERPLLVAYNAQFDLNFLYHFLRPCGRVEVLGQMGVDTVTLANNHVYDYGKEALLDTFQVLEEAGIPYFGAGRTLEEARKPLYLEADGKTVALVAASRAEKNKMTPQATETEPGILRCYDTELFLETIREAEENSDFCIAFVHWGTEYSFDLEQVQLETGKEYLDAGADIVIGAHSHCLQGMEYYDGKPIVYSLGNYWFNEKTLDTMLLWLHFWGDDAQDNLTVQVIPAVQAGYRTTYAAEETEQRRIYDFLESISVNVSISDEGIVMEE